jgi:UV DNA damage repair endonuclease
MAPDAGFKGSFAMTETPRLGYCCKFLAPDDPALEKAINVRIFTAATLQKLSPADGYDKVAEIVAHNLASTRALIAEVAQRPAMERLLRISSDLLPRYTHPLVRKIYDDADLHALIARELATAGDEARTAGIRVSMHPAQHAILATSGGALANAIADIEYHADVMAMLGYGSGWHPQGASVNVHGGQRAAGIEGLRHGLSLLSEAARNLVTVENDEVSFGVDDLIQAADAVAIVVDIHHHWIKSEGEWIEPEDPRLDPVRASWRGVRPLCHVSVSREPLLDGHDPDVKPDYAALIAAGISAKDLRGHSDMMWNRAVNDLVMRHLAWADFEVEAKLKNFASEQLADHVRAALAA